METITDAIDKRFGKSLVAFLKLVDPERKYRIDENLGKTWDRLSLEEQRKLYLYLLYRKWRGLDIYGEPYYIIMNCHPVPYDWNGSQRCAELIAERKSADRQAQRLLRLVHERRNTAVRTGGQKVSPQCAKLNIHNADFIVVTPWFYRG